MVEVGSVSIKGSIDTSSIEQGIMRMKDSFRALSGDLSTLVGPFQSIDGSVSRLAKSMMTVGTLGITAMSGLAALSPAVAPALAKMQIGFRELSFTLGDQLRPAFDAVANDLIPAMVEAVNMNSGAIESFVGTVSGAISDVGNLITGNLDEIKNKVPKAASLGAAIGYKFGGPAGMFVGAALGLAAGIGSELSIASESIGGQENQAAIEDAIFGGTPSSSRARQGYDGNVLGIKSHVETISGGIELGQALLNKIIEAITRSRRVNTEYADKNGVSR